MELNFHVTGLERKRLVTAMTKFLNCEVQYLGVPLALIGSEISLLKNRGCPIYGLCRRQPSPTAYPKLENAQAPPIGTKGTMQGVDDAGSILVRWDNGCGLNVVYDADICRRIPESSV